jgi:hypothetical protein
MGMSDQRAIELIETLPDHVAYVDEPGTAQAVSSCQAAEVIEHVAAWLSGQAKAMLQQGLQDDAHPHVWAGEGGSPNPATDR